MLDAAELGPETLQLTARGEEARGPAASPLWPLSPARTAAVC